MYGVGFNMASLICVNIGSGDGFLPDVSHYLNQCCSRVNQILMNIFQWDIRSLNQSSRSNAFENTVCKMVTILFRPKYVDSLLIDAIWRRRYWWWRHQMETFFRVTGICAGNWPVTGEFPSQRPVTQSFDVFFYLRLNKRLSKQSISRWFETPSRSLWNYCHLINIGSG